MLKIVWVLLSLITTTVFAQTMNLAAVDTLTKDVAIAVFEPISQQPNQPKAQEIYEQLLNCSDGCDPQIIIRTVGSWDQVGAKMQELSELKNTQRYLTMTSAQANTAIREQLTRFYEQHKAEKPYSIPLNAATRAQILAKIDRMLPPATETTAPTPAVSKGPADAPVVADDGSGIDPAQLRISQLETQLKQRDESQLWRMIVSGLIGLILGAGGVYLLLYRGAQAEAKQLLAENNRVRNELETAQRSRPGNAVDQTRTDYRQKADAYNRILNELDTDDPIKAIRHLKRQANLPKPTSAVRPVESAPETSATLESALIQPPPVVVLEPVPVPIPAPPRSEVFYFPPPDPTGQFDLSRKSEMLLPESAYRFSVNAETPTVATFRFEAEPSRVTRFITYRNYMIEPACDSENSYTSTHTRIEMRKNGEAVLENGAWRVKTKALIRYE